MNGSWLLPPKQTQFHYRVDERSKFICGQPVPKNINRATENDLAGYSLKCENCLLRFFEQEEGILH